jgi:hypothetical protein
MKIIPISRIINIDRKKWLFINTRRFCNWTILMTTYIIVVVVNIFL